MAGLLAAEGESTGVEGLEHVAIAHRRVDDVDAEVPHAEAESEVGHHRDHDGVVGQHAAGLQVGGGDGHQLVAVDQATRRVDGQHPVGVAVEREPDVRAVGHDRGLETLGVGRPAGLVDVAAVGLGVDHGHLGPELGEGLRGQGRGGAVAAVEHDLQAVEARPGAPTPHTWARYADSDVVLAHHADVGAGGRRRRRAACVEHGLDLRPGPRRTASCRPDANSLMPLSPNGLCDAEIIAAGTRRRPRRVGHRRRGHHAEQLDVDAFGCRRRRRRPPRASGPSAGGRDRSSERSGHRRTPAPRRGRVASASSRSQLRVGDTADAVGTEAHAPDRTQRLEYCGALRAFLRPYFFDSFSRESRVRKPAFFSVRAKLLVERDQRTGDAEAQGAGLAGRRHHRGGWRRCRTTSVSR